MTEINIQRKERAIWPWVVAGILLVLLVLLLAGVFSSDDDEYNSTERADTTAQYTSPVESPETGMPASVSTYVNLVRQNDAREKMGIDHEYTSTALKNLAAAIGAVASQNGVDNANVNDMRTKITENADQLQKDPHAVNHADLIRESAVSAADMMKELQASKYPNLQSEVTAMQEAAQAIKPGTLTLEQKDRILTFFREAGNALEAMVRTRS